MSRTGYCFGIDLGTSNSSICYINPNARHPLPYVHVEAVRMPKAESADYSTRLPSILFTNGKAVKAGFEALSLWKQGRIWETMFPSAKSELGAHRFYDDAVSDKLDTPVKVQAEILRRLIGAAKDRTGEDPRQCHVVVTVPASFAMSQRKDTLEAAKLAGLDIGDGDLLDEPNAAFLDLVNSQAIDRLDLSTPKNVLVFDFGGGTCDVSILRVQRDDNHPPLALLIQNLAISNYARLGGDNLDLLLVRKALLPAVCRGSGIEFENLSERDQRDLRWNLKEAACRLKERLCEKAGTQRLAGRCAELRQAWALDAFPLSDAGLSTKKVKGQMSFHEFEGLLEPFIGRLTDNEITLADGYYAGSLFAPVLAALDKARLSPDQVEAVLFNGGSCRNPLVVRAFKELDIFPHGEMLDQGDLDLAVARGAAVRCFFKHCQQFDPITPIVTAELGLMTHGDHCEALVAAGTPLPFPASGQFQRLMDRFWVPKDRMTKLHFPIYSGKEGNRSLVQTMSLDLPEGMARGDAVVIELQIDSSKMLHFRAFLPDHPGAPLDVTLENPLAVRAPSPEKRAALEERKRLAERRLADRLFRPSPGQLVALANLERLADEPERALDILQRLQVRLKRAGAQLPASAHNIMGLAYGLLGRCQLSYEHHKQASELESGDGTYAANCGYELIQLGRANEAVPYLKRATVCAAQDGYPFVVLGDALRQLGREDEAVQEYQEAKKRLEGSLRSYPHNRHLLGWTGGVCRRLSLYEEAARLDRRQHELARSEYLGVSPDDIVAGMDSGIVGSGELAGKE